MFLVINIVVRDHLPLKQGLRPHDKIVRVYNVSSQRPSSIKTRIKTVSNDFIHDATGPRQRPSSIKTRIKTIS